MIAEAKATGKNIRTYYQDIVFTPQALEACLNQGKFRWWNICNWELTTREQNYFPSISTSSDGPKPEPQYKVGDYLEVDENGKIVHCYIVPKSEANQEISGLLYNLSTPKRWVGCIYRNKPNTHIIRKLKPSEVQIKIGCLSGTVKDLSYVEDGRFWFIGGKTERCPGGMHAILYDEMLDTQTREIVESLIKAQQEEHND